MPGDSLSATPNPLNCSVLNRRIPNGAQTEIWNVNRFGAPAEKAALLESHLQKAKEGMLKKLRTEPRTMPADFKMKSDVTAGTMEVD